MLEPTVCRRNVISSEIEVIIKSEEVSRPKSRSLNALTEGFAWFWTCIIVCGDVNSQSIVGLCTV